MRVTLGAADGESEPDGARRRGAVDGGLRPVEFEIGAGFVVFQGVAVKPGGDLLLQRGRGQQVAGQLLDRELVERLVAVDGVDDPVAVKVRVRPQRIVEVAGAVGIAREVEPVPAPAFAEVR